MTHLLAQATQAQPGWPAALIAIVTALVPVAMSVLAYLRERARRKDAENNVETMVEGIERAGDTNTKAFVRDTAKVRGDKTLEGKVQKITKKLAPILLLGASLFLLSGCCTLDHDALAALADRYAGVAEKIKAKPDEKLTPAFVREYAEEERRGWRITEGRLRGEEVVLLEEGGK